MTMFTKQIKTTLSSLFTTVMTVAIFFTSASSSNAQLSFGGGLSTPSDNIADIYGKVSFDNWEKKFADGKNLGYHLRAQYLMPFGDDARFYVSAAFHRFPGNEIKWAPTGIPGAPTEIVTQTVQNIVPIGAGIELPIFRNFLGLFLTGELSYNYFFSTDELLRPSVTDLNGFPLPINKTPSYSRVGATFGVGTDLNILVGMLELTARYNMANLVGREDGEAQKNFVSLTASFVFGSKSSTKRERD